MRYEKDYIVAPIADYLNYEKIIHYRVFTRCFLSRKAQTTTSETPDEKSGTGSKTKAGCRRTFP